ncbi:hypothetical protein X777_06602 [Ooceraea biroi]|uniref:Endonuclease/exonuclease/phosphatase domain-containing protein n=1 Tax=Ooceraea biroi TaxID=2015173 RepID=A0A026WFU7_OOCBI|nr:hypothetical protein X777_06602 [Ooceraea biroi]
MKSKKAELANYIVPYDIVILTETKVSKDTAVYFSGYRTYKTKNVGSEDGIAILVKEDIKFEVIDEWKINSKNIEAIDIRVKSISRIFNFIAVYRKPYGNEKLETWNELLKFRGMEDCSIILGDFNAHHCTWNCADTDLNGERLYTFVNFCNSINRYTNISYMWNNMRIFKNVQRKINWNTWHNKDSESEIRRTIDELFPP